MKSIFDQNSLMFSLYYEVCDRYLIKDLRIEIMKVLCMSHITPFTRIRLGFGGKLDIILTHDMRPLIGSISEGCLMCNGILVPYTGTMTIVLPIVDEPYNLLLPVCHGCLFYDMDMDYCKKYKPFLKLIHPNLYIDL